MRLFAILILGAWTLAAAVELDSVDDELECGSTNGLDELCASGNPCSIVAWIKPDSSGEGNQGKIVFDGSFGDTSIISFGVAGASPNETLELEVQFSTTPLLRRASLGSIDVTGVWQHVAATHDGSQVAANSHLYIDGVEPSYAMTTDGSGTRNSSAGEPFHVGNNFGGSGTFDGRLAEVAVFDRELTAAEIALLAAAMQRNLPLGLEPLAYWRLFDRAEGATLSGAGIVLDETGGFGCTPANGPTARAAPFGVQ